MCVCRGGGGQGVVDSWLMCGAGLRGNKPVKHAVALTASLPPVPPAWLPLLCCPCTPLPSTARHPTPPPPPSRLAPRLLFCLFGLKVCPQRNCDADPTRTASPPQSTLLCSPAEVSRRRHD